MGVQL
jgi:hypothetical protein